MRLPFLLDPQPDRTARRNDVMTMLGDLIEKRLAALDLDLGFKERVCLRPVSKDLQGVFHLGQRERQPCKEPDCLTLKIDTKLEANAVQHVCDRVPELDGQLSGRVLFAFEGSEQGRALHLGQVVWNSIGGFTLHGTMSGIVNAGTHRPPAADCERCDQGGRITGVLEAVVRDRPQQGCVLLASYALTFDFGAFGQSTAFVGAIEGVFVCPCLAPT